MPPYLDDLPGIKTVRALGSAPVPQRAALSFEGAVSAADDPVNEQTVVTFEGGGAVVQAIDVEVGTDESLLAHAELAAADLVRIAAQDDEGGPAAVRGLDTTGLLTVRKTLVNLGPSALLLVHDASETDAAHRLLLPGSEDLWLQVDQCVELVYVPAGTGISAGWRAVA
jgi:hypothetical protein